MAKTSVDNDQSETSLVKIVLVLLFGLFLLSGLNLTVKYLGQYYPSQQIAMLRNLFGIIPLFLIMHWQGGAVFRLQSFSFPKWPRAVFRGLLAAVAQFLFFWALTEMELATARTISYIGPIFITILAALFLHDQVGIWRWMAVGIGFFGVILVLRPNSGSLSYYSLLPVASAALMAVSFVVMRTFNKSTSHAAINLVSTVTALLGSVVILIATQKIQWPAGLWHWILAIATGFLGGLGVFCVSWCYRNRSPVQLAPFQYLSLVYALLFGWLFFDELPLDNIFPGFLFIAGAGLIIVWRESLRKKKTPILHSSGL